jgi:phenylacetate-CoA ligase
LERQQATRQKQSDAKAAAVFGGFATQAFGASVRRVFASPGPIYEPEGTAKRLLAHGQSTGCGWV